MSALPRTPSLRLDGMRALVAGASSGIGQGCALALADAGAEVACLSRREERLAETVREIEARGGAARAIPVDMGDIDRMREALAGEQFDIVLNSAGLARHGPALDAAPDDFDAVMSINLRAAFFLSTWAARMMIDAGRPGSIIHISSQMGHVGGIDRAIYCASKHALEGMIKAMAIEWGPRGIRINSICPTFIRTPLTQATLDDPERRKWIGEKIKLGRVGEIEDVMGAAVYLASPASSLVTGTAMLIDGGWTAE